jgi:hypothetical protein
MPTNRTVRTRRWSPELNVYRRQSLLLGPDTVLLAGAAYYRMGCNNLHLATEEQHTAALAAMRLDWAAHRQALLAWWIAGEDTGGPKPWAWVYPRGPGTRPWAWWKFDAPEDLREGESEASYLDRLRLFVLGEKVRSDGVSAGKKPVSRAGSEVWRLER